MTRIDHRSPPDEAPPSAPSPEYPPPDLGVGWQQPQPAPLQEEDEE